MHVTSTVDVYCIEVATPYMHGWVQASVAEALSLLTDKRDVLLSGMPPASAPTGAALLDAAYASLKKLELAVAAQQPDTVSIRVADVLKSVAELELLQAPGLPFVLPKDYQVRTSRAMHE